MALADTAKLVASLTLEDKFSGPLGRAGTALGGFEAKASTLSRVGGELSRGLGAAANNLKLIGIAGAGLLAVNIKAGIDSLEKLEEVTTASNAVIASTGAVAGQTADSIRNLAEKYESINALIDDKVIQSGENLLLTFTNIRKDAFEPALQAALDLNTALGGGEEGLQNVIIQVGKALNDPIRGLTNLRRVGVSFTADQQAKIKSLVAENDLYGAQQIILSELSTEFGGRFAAAGTTAAAKYAKFTDAIEGAQQALATAFLPLLGKVAEKLTTFLSDKQVLARIESLGSDLAGGFDKLIQVGGSLPWAEIGSAFEIVGTGSKALLDAFLGLPPWVQTAVLTGWGLNKLTGGALGNIVGILGKDLIKGVLGMNAGVVNINAGVVNGVGGVPGTGGTPAGGTGGVIRQVAGAATVVGGGLAIGGIIGGAIQEGIVAGARAAEDSAVSRLLNQNTTTRDDLQHAIDTIDGQLTDIKTNQITQIAAGSSEFAGLFTGQKGVISTLADQRAALVAKLEALDQTTQDGVSEFKKSRATLADLQRPLRDQVLAIQQADAVSRGQNNAILAAANRAAADQAVTANEARNIARYTGIDAAKPPPSFAVTIPVTAVANINVNGFLRTVTSAWIASASGGAGPALDPTKLY